MFAAVFPALAMQSQWYIVALGGVVSLGLILFGELVVRNQAESWYRWMTGGGEKKISGETDYPVRRRIDADEVLTRLIV